MKNIQELLKGQGLKAKTLAIPAPGKKAAEYICRLEYRVDGEGFMADVMVLSVNGTEAFTLTRDIDTGDQDKPVNITHLIEEGALNVITLDQFNLKVEGTETRSEFSLRVDGRIVVKESYDSDGALFRSTTDNWVV